MTAFIDSNDFSLHFPRNTMFLRHMPPNGRRLRIGGATFAARIHIYPMMYVIRMRQHVASLMKLPWALVTLNFLLRVID